MILNALFHDFVAKFINGTWAGSVSISGEVTSLSDVLSGETYNALETWESQYNKTSPFAYPMDRERWMNFITLLHKDEIELSIDDFSQWLSEDKKWSIGLNMQINELTESLEYSLELLR